MLLGIVIFSYVDLRLVIIRFYSQIRPDCRSTTNNFENLTGADRRSTASTKLLQSTNQWHTVFAVSSSWVERRFRFAGA